MLTTINEKEWQEYWDSKGQIYEIIALRTSTGYPYIVIGICPKTKEIVAMDGEHAYKSFAVIGRIEDNYEDVFCYNYLFTLILTAYRDTVIIEFNKYKDK